MKLSVNIKFSSLVGIFKKNLSLVLLGFLVLIFLMAGFVVYGEIRKITESKGNPATAGQIVRVNLEGHKQLEKKLNDNMTYEPQSVDGAEAFGTAPNKSN